MPAAWSRKQEVSQMMTRPVAQAWRREGERQGGRRVVVLNQQWPVCFVFIMIPVGSHRDALLPHTHIHTCTSVPGEALKYSTQHIRRAMRTHTYSYTHKHTQVHTAHLWFSFAVDCLWSCSQSVTLISLPIWVPASSSVHSCVWVCWCEEASAFPLVRLPPPMCFLLSPICVNDVLQLCFLCVCISCPLSRRSWDSSSSCRVTPGSCLTSSLMFKNVYIVSIKVSFGYLYLIVLVYSA